MNYIQDYIPVRCIPPAHWPYLPACSAPGGGGGVPAWSGGGACLVPGGGACLVLEGSCLVRGGCLPGPGGGDTPACTEADPHGQNSWHRLLKILPCPKLRLRAVITDSCDSVHIKTLTLNSITWNCNCKCVQYVTYLCINHNLLLSWAYWFNMAICCPISEFCLYKSSRSFQTKARIMSK